jgi:WD40 repeat protein
VQVWLAHEEALLLSEPSNDARMSTVTFSLDEEWLALRTSSSEVKVVYLPSRNTRNFPLAGNSPVLFAPNNSLLVRKEGEGRSIEFDRWTCRIDRKEIRLEPQNPVRLERSEEFSGSASLDIGLTDGSLFFSVNSPWFNSTDVAAWQLDTGRLVGVARINSKVAESQLLFSPDGRRFLFPESSRSGRVRRLRLAALSSEPVRPVDISGTSRVPWASADGMVLITKSDESANIPAIAWRSAFGLPRSPALRHAAAVCRCRWTPSDGTIVATSSWDHTARLWNVHTGRPIGMPLEHEGLVVDVAFRGDGKLVATASWDGTVRLWETATAEPMGEPLRLGAAMNSVSFSPDGTAVLAASDDGTLRTVELATKRPMVLDFGTPVVEAAYSHDGKCVASVTADGNAYIWWPSVDTLRPRSVLDMSRVAGNVGARLVRFSPDDRRFVIGCADGSVRLWDTQRHESLAVSALHRASVTCAAFDPTGHRLATGRRDGTVQLWDASTLEPAERAVMHDAPVLQLAFSPDGKWLATGQDDGTVRLWECDTALPLAPPLMHSGPVRDVAFSPDGHSLITASEDGTARVWRFPRHIAVPAGRLEEAVRDHVGGALDQAGAYQSIAPSRSAAASDLRRDAFDPSSFFGADDATIFSSWAAACVEQSDWAAAWTNAALATALDSSDMRARNALWQSRTGMIWYGDSTVSVAGSPMAITRCRLLDVPADVHASRLSSGAAAGISGFLAGIATHPPENHFILDASGVGRILGRHYDVADLSDVSQSDWQSLLEHIRRETWEGHSGRGFLRLDRARADLFVAQVEGVHTQIELLLAHLRNLKAEPGTQIALAPYWLGEGETESTLHRSLDAPIDFVYDEAPLDQVVEDLRQTPGLNIDLYPGTFQPITCNLKRVPLRTVLDLVLADLPVELIDQRGTRAIIHGHTSAPALHSRLYPVRDLAVDGEEGQALIDLITSAVTPDTWEELGGPGSIILYKAIHSLVVRDTTIGTHRQIELLLESIRAVRFALRTNAAVQPRWVFHTETRKQFDEALGQRIDLDVGGATIEQVVDLLRQTTGANIHVDAAHVGQLAPDASFTCHLAGLPMSVALRRMLSEQYLSLINDRGIGVLTTEEQAAGRLEPRFYPAPDLTKNGEGADSLIDLITSTVVPDSWEELFGPGSIRFYLAAQSLLIRQTPEAHAQVVTLLSNLRAIRAAVGTEAAIVPRWCNQTERSEKLDVALDEPIDLEFDRVPLQDFFQDLRQRTRVNIHLDKRQLTDANVSLDALITCRVEQVPLRAALDRSLAEYGLAVVDEDGIGVIMSLQSRGERLSSRLYPVSDLTQSVEKAQSLIDLITSTVVPDSWDNVSGPGSVKFYPAANCLLIRQTVDIHRQIHTFLSAQRQRAAPP